jgi:hypothetical protein
MTPDDILDGKGRVTASAETLDRTDALRRASCFWRVYARRIASMTVFGHRAVGRTFHAEDWYEPTLSVYFTTLNSLL